MKCMYGKCDHEVAHKVKNRRGGVVGYLCGDHKRLTWDATPHPGLDTKPLTEGGDESEEPYLADTPAAKKRRQYSFDDPGQDLFGAEPESGGPGPGPGGITASDSDGAPDGEQLPASAPAAVYWAGGDRMTPATTARSQLDVFAVAEALARCGYFADIKDVSQAVVKLLAGQELGLGPIASVQGIHIIQGKPAFSASLVSTVIQRSGWYNYRVVTLTESECAIEFYERGGSVGQSTFTLEDARQAGLLAGRNAHSWRNYPRNMLFARALTNGARWYAMGAFGGSPPYTPEELGEQAGPFKPGREPDPITDSEYHKPEGYDEAARRHVAAIAAGES